MHQAHNPSIDPALWEAIRQRADQDQVSPEAWLERQLTGADPAVVSYGGGETAVSEEEAMLELALSHFRGLDLNRDEARDLANAIFMTIETGESQPVGPVGLLQRRYVIQRRAAAVSIRIGEGRISLPLSSAMRLAGALHGPVDLKVMSRIAA